MWFEIARFLVQLVLFVPVFVTILLLKIFGLEDAATEIEDWWLHL